MSALTIRRALFIQDFGEEREEKRKTHFVHSRGDKMRNSLAAARNCDDNGAAHCWQIQFGQTSLLRCSFAGKQIYPAAN